jgi:predicted phage-related endonuclease
MLITGFEVCDVPVSIGGGSPELYEVPADKELQEMIIEACAAFWRRVQDGNPPDPISYADAVQRYGSSRAEGVVVASGDAIATVDDLRAVREEIKRLEAIEEELRGRIIITLGDAGDTLALPDGTTLVTYKMGKGRKSFDVKAFQKDHPDLFDRYSKTGEPSRRFLVK